MRGVATYSRFRRFQVSTSEERRPSLKRVKSYDPIHDERAFFLTAGGAPAGVLHGPGAAAGAPAPVTWPPASAIARSRCASWTSSGSADDPAQQAEVTQTIYDGRRAALEAIIAEQLLAEAAKKKGMSADALPRGRDRQAREAGQRRRGVTFYQSNINQMQGRSLEEMAPAINRYLTDQRATRRATP